MRHSTGQHGVPAQALLACPVINRDGESLGVIDDLIIEPRSGSIAYVMLARESAAGGTPKLFSIPFGHVEIEAELCRAVVDLAPTVLDASPGTEVYAAPETGAAS